MKNTHKKRIKKRPTSETSYNIKFTNPSMRIKGFGARVWLGKGLWRDASKSDLIKNPHGKWQTIWTTSTAE
ncbi:MAG: hypothetical protein Unbinned3806contig1000_70 [Prokaryotic dsDNA virus sp.]|nr:MAG: hypothetical protein Unbinned3806contig1000_70 [Prokaryotic dsDNA virus sp.]